ncbi:MAG: trypsin-like peptidase domain-containing protein [Pirellulaceae bacterium]|nr:trypsin-like peptidase domain-containing protein [Pirellulaceae bacterium]
MLTIRFKKRMEGVLPVKTTELPFANFLVALLLGVISIPGLQPVQAQDFAVPQPQLVYPPQEILSDPPAIQTAPIQGVPLQQVIPSQAAPTNVNPAQGKTQNNAQNNSQGNSSAAVRSSAKPIVNANSPDVVGATFVALDSRLKQVFRGSEPKSLAELRAMDEQQAKVAAVIDQVTVNVQQGSAQGSGVIVSGDGYILTAAHVAGKPGRQAWVRFSDGRRVEAKTLGMDRNNDAGLLKIVEPRSTPWPHATRGRSENLKEGQWCIAAGHPGGWQPKRGSVIRVGRILSIKGRSSSNAMANTLFTDCTLIGGDSGGPLFTLEGKLIGIHSRIGTDMEDNMHVPIEVFDADDAKLKKGEAWGVLPGFRPLIGVRGPKASATSQNAPATVAEVIPDSPAEVAGIIVGDVIKSFDGVKIGTFAELQSAVEQTLPGDTVMIEIIRDGTSFKFPLVVGVEGD